MTPGADEDQRGLRPEAAAATGLGGARARGRRAWPSAASGVVGGSQRAEKDLGIMVNYKSLVGTD